MPSQSDYAKDLIEERAAIMEYCAGLPRKEAEDKAARLHGFRDYKHYRMEANK
jgi:hypothetical protein